MKEVVDIRIVYLIIIKLLLNMKQITVTLSQPNVAGALYKVSEDMPMSVDARELFNRMTSGTVPLLSPGGMSLMTWYHARR